MDQPLDSRIDYILWELKEGKRLMEELSEEIRLMEAKKFMLDNVTERYEFNQAQLALMTLLKEINTQHNGPAITLSN